MSNYYTIKNSVLYAPLAEDTLGQIDDDFGNIFLTGNVFIDTGRVIGPDLVMPKVTSLIYANNALAADVVGGETVIVQGYSFQSNVVVKIANVTVASVTRISDSELQITAPAKLEGNYLFTVTNPDGGVGTFIPGINYSPKPQWVTNVTTYSYYEADPIDVTVAVTSKDYPHIFQIQSGSLPGGVTLSSDGRITGTAPNVESNTNYTANISVTDWQLQTSYRTFTFNILAETLTWLYPAEQYFDYIEGDDIIIGFAASSLSGRPITYSSAGSYSIKQNIYGDWHVDGKSQASTLSVIVVATVAGTSIYKTITIRGSIDTVTWSFPASQQVFYATDGQSFEPVTLSASSLSGRPVTFTGPNVTTNFGLDFDGTTISGTLNVPNLNNTTLYSLTFYAVNSMGRQFPRDFKFQIAPRFDLSSFARDGFFEERSLIRERINGVYVNRWRLTGSYLETGATPNGGRIGKYAIVIHMISAASDGPVYGIVPDGFSMIHSNHLIVPHYPRDSINNPTASITVAVYIRYLDGTDTSGYQQFLPPSDDGSLYYSHAGKSLLVGFNKPVSGYEVIQQNTSGGFISNYPIDYGTRLNLSVDTTYVPAGSLVIGYEFNGAGRAYTPSGIGQANLETPSYRWGLGDTVTDKYSLNFVQGYYAVSNNYFSSMPSSANYPAPNPMNMHSGTYNASSIYFGSGVDRFYGLNVGLGYLVIRFY